MRRLIVPCLFAVSLAACVRTGDMDASSPIVFDKVTLEGEFPALTDFRFLPGSQEFLALGRSGKVGYFKLAGNKAKQIGSMTIPSVHSSVDCGAASLALDPDFASNKFFYVSFCTDPQSSTVMRYSFDGNYFGTALQTGREIISAGDPLSTRSIHGITAIRFDAAGAMLISVGEKGRAENAQDLTNPLGKIVRIIPNRDAAGEGYQVPADNPFVGGDPSDDIVFAYGLRNPWRAEFDSAGRYWMADVGSTFTEEINVALRPGQNFGWPRTEGPCKAACDGISDPVISYSRSVDNAFIRDDAFARTSTKFRVAWVGKEYVPEQVDRYDGLLTGKMIYGEWYVGWMRAVSVGPDGAVESDMPIGHLPFAVSFDTGSDGYHYAGTMFGAVELDENGNPQFASAADMNGVLWRMVLREERAENTL